MKGPQMPALPETGPMTVTQLRDALAMDRDAVYALLHAGKGPGFFVGKRFYGRWEWFHKWIAGEIGLWSPPVVAVEKPATESPFIRALPAKRKAS